MAINQNPNYEPNYKSEQRIYAALFVVMLGALVLGWWQINNNIQLPFAWLKNKPTNQSPIITDEQGVLLTKDTDNDGLSDYDELYLYHTSPYLADSDSDGYADKTEIESNHDPNCPANQTCLKAKSSFTSGAVQPQNISELRKVLIQAGVPEEQLKNIDDASLLEVFNEVAQETGATMPATTGEANTNTAVNANTEQPALTAEQKQLLSKMSGAELRTFLKQSGVASTELDQIDDNTLKTIVSQTLGL